MPNLLQQYCQWPSTALLLLCPGPGTGFSLEPYYYRSRRRHTQRHRSFQTIMLKCTLTSLVIFSLPFSGTFVESSRFTCWHYPSYLNLTTSAVCPERTGFMGNLCTTAYKDVLGVQCSPGIENRRGDIFWMTQTIIFHMMSSAFTHNFFLLTTVTQDNCSVTGDKANEHNSTPLTKHKTQPINDAIHIRGIHKKIKKKNLKITKLFS